MIPEWSFWGLVVLNCAQAIGWGWTIRRSAARAFYMYDEGRRRERARRSSARQNRRASRLSKRWS